MPDSAITTAYRSAMEVIAAAEPDVAEAIAGELALSAPPAEAHRLGELRLACGFAGDGQLVVGQVCRGNARAPAVRGLRDGRPYRDSRRRPRHSALRLRSRLRPAAFGDRRQPRRATGRSSRTASRPRH